MIRFYYHPTPNPLKISLFLEETGLPYEVVPVDTSKGEQHLPAFKKINPNGKVPAIIDTDGPGRKEARVFDSSAILLYLSDKTGKFGGSPEDRPELMSWQSRPASARSLARRCTSSCSRPPAPTMPSTATGARRSGITRWSKTILLAELSSSATVTRSPTCRSGAGSIARCA
jgi:hypothetical protein